MVENTQDRSEKKSLLVIDDVDEIRFLLQKTLINADFEVAAAQDGVEALSILSEGLSPDLIILDLMLPRMSGLDFLRLINKRYPHLKAIVISARGDVETVVTAMQMGALDYIHKPFDLEEIKIAVRKALSQKEMMEELDRLKKRELFNEDDTMLYASSEMADVMEMVSKVAQTDVPLLITGESGVGKEIVAREIHQRSNRASGPFLKINCAALPASLLESELFGFEKGAFTGAIKTKTSKFETAEKGTLFLDEIGEIDPSLQAKFLHVLQDGAFNRLGSNKLIRSNARLAVATNQDLEKAVQSGAFRADLFYRLNVVRIQVPPLKERPVDISLLAAHFLKIYNKKYGRTLDLDQPAFNTLRHHHWPGNVRELQNVIRRYVVLGQLEIDDHRDRSKLVVSVPPGPPTPSHPQSAESFNPDSDDPNISLKDVAKKAARKAERETILRTLEMTQWNKAQTARILKISYKALLYKIKECGLDQHYPNGEK